jgi:hypothetical protein
LDSGTEKKRLHYSADDYSIQQHPQPQSIYTLKLQDGILPFLTNQIVPAAVALIVIVRIIPALIRNPCSKKPVVQKVSKAQ